MAENTKADSLDVMTEVNDNHDHDVKVAKQMARQISKMYEDRDLKATNAKHSLVSQLDVLSHKYLTVNGMMTALDAIRSVFGKKDSVSLAAEIEMAKRIAVMASAAALAMSEKAQQLEPEDFDTLVDGFFDDQFVTKEGLGGEAVALELMYVQLCQNAGPSADDLADFLMHADAEIEKARDDLRSYCDENDIDFYSICGCHEDCWSCLCMSCANDCKKNLQIKEGQSAYDVCEDFVEDEE